MNAVVTIRQRERARSTAIYLDYRSADGKRHNKPIGRARHGDAEALAALEADAEREAARIRHELLSGTHRAKVGAMLIADALAEFLQWQRQTKRAQSTCEGYATTIKAFRAFLEGRSVTRLAQVTPAIALAFIAHERARGLSGTSINLECVHLACIFNRAAEAGHIQASPFKHPDVRAAKPSPSRRERAFTAAEVARLLEAVADADYRDFFQVLAETGLRVSELRMLRWADVSLERRTLRIRARADWKPKTKHAERAVPLTDAVAGILSVRLRAVGEVQPAAYVFPAHRCNQVIGVHFRRALKLAWLDGVDENAERLCIHSLRHGFATMLAHSGAPVSVVRDVLGHHSIMVTNIYFGSCADASATAVQRAFSTPQRGEIIPLEVKGR